MCLRYRIRVFSLRFPVISSDTYRVESLLLHANICKVIPCAVAGEKPTAGSINACKLFEYYALQIRRQRGDGLLRATSRRCRRMPRDFNLTMSARSLNSGSRNARATSEDSTVRGSNYRANYSVTSLIDR